MMRKVEEVSFDLQVTGLGCNHVTGLIPPYGSKAKLSSTFLTIQNDEENTEGDDLTVEINPIYALSVFLSP